MQLGNLNLSNTHEDKLIAICRPFTQNDYLLGTYDITCEYVLAEERPENLDEPLF